MVSQPLSFCCGAGRKSSSLEPVVVVLTYWAVLSCKPCWLLWQVWMPCTACWTNPWHFSTACTSTALQCYVTSEHRFVNFPLFIAQNYIYCSYKCSEHCSCGIVFYLLKLRTLPVWTVTQDVAFFLYRRMLSFQVKHCSAAPPTPIICHSSAIVWRVLILGMLNK